MEKPIVGDSVGDFFHHLKHHGERIMKKIDKLVKDVISDVKELKDDTPLTDRERQLFEALKVSTDIYFNYTGNYPCTNLSDWEGTGDLDGYGWNILACN